MTIAHVLDLQSGNLPCSDKSIVDDVAVVIACPNDPDTLRALTTSVRSIAAQSNISASLYVVGTGERESTLRVARELGTTVLEKNFQGYGALINAAADVGPSTFVLTMDADAAHPPHLIPYLYGMRHNADLIIASRYVAQGCARMPLWRTALSRALNASFRSLLSLPFRDLSSSYRLYRRSVLNTLSPVTPSNAGLQEILIKSFCEGYSIAEIPMHYTSKAMHRLSDIVGLATLGIDYVLTFGAMWKLRNSVASADYDTRAFFSRIPIQRWWQRRRYAIVSEYVGTAARILDAGCGSTQLLNRFPQTIGMDVSRRKLRFMRRPGRRLVNASTFQLPFQTGAFDVVMSSQVIEHLPDDPRIFDELLRCLAPGGTLVLGTVDYGRWQWPLIEWLYGRFKPTGYAQEHITHFTKEALVTRLQRRGLTILDIRYIAGGEIIIKASKPNVADVGERDDSR